MADKLAFDLVSPEALLLSDEVDMVVLPGAEGDMGVLKGHSPAITTIRPGTICVFEGKSVAKRLFVAGGFAEVTPDRCTVLAEEAVSLDDIETSAVEQQIKDLQDDLSVAGDDVAKRAIDQAIDVARAKLDAVSNPVY